MAGLRVQRSGFRVEGPGFRVQGPGVRVQGSGVGSDRIGEGDRADYSQVDMLGSRYLVSRVQGPGSRVGSGFRL